MNSSLQSALPNAKEKLYNGLSGSTLKILAMILMFIDHIGSVIVFKYNDAKLETIGYVMMRRLDTVYLILKSIGRGALPIFCFLLVEGFYHTTNKWKYLGRLVLLALISEIPFNLAFRDKLFAKDLQNVFFALSISLLMLILCDMILGYEKMNYILRTCIFCCIIAAAAYLAYYFKFDYNYKLPLCVAGLYFLRPLKKEQALAGAAMFSWEWVDKLSYISSSLIFIPIYFYNGKRGLKIKYLFYFFYPVHLFLFYLLRVFLLSLG